MVCQYVTKKGKTCTIKKVDEETQMCSKHIKNYLNKKEKGKENEIEKEQEEHISPIKMVDKSLKVKKEIEKKKKKEKKEKKDKNFISFDNDEENELDEIVNDNMPEDAFDDDNDYENDPNYSDHSIIEGSVPTIEVEKKSKDFQLAVLKMAYNTCTSILESMSDPYLQNFSNQCATDPNINKCIEDLNNENNIEIFMNASPEIRLLFFTGVIATQKIANSITMNNKQLSHIKTFETPKQEEDEYADL